MSPDPRAFSLSYLKYLTHIIESLDTQEIAKVIEILKEAHDHDRYIFFIGNGGSAATASHFAVDLGKGTKVHGVKPFKALSLTDNVAYMTAQSNDEGYDSVFVGQLENFMKPGDVVIGITASGNSPNLVEAFQYAREQGAKTVGILGFDGGKLQHLSDASIIVRTPKGEYGPVEDLHMVMDHLITNYLYRWMRHKEHV
jgi:D-sedoheptulose 7-phosphate isomerase